MNERPIYGFASADALARGWFVPVGGLFKHLLHCFARLIGGITPAMKLKMAA